MTALADIGVFFKKNVVGRRAEGPVEGVFTNDLVEWRNRPSFAARREGDFGARTRHAVR